MPRDKTTNSPEEFDRLPVFETSPDLTTFDFLEKEDEHEHTKDISYSTVSDNQSPENIFEVNIPTTRVNLVDDYIGYQLPFRHNRGKPPN